MSREIYKKLFEVMKARGGPYAAVDTPEFYTLMAELFTPEEAAVNNALTRKPVPAAAIAAKLNRDERDLTQILEKMANKGLCGVFVKEGGVKLWQGLPFMPGIFEYQFFSGGETERHKKIAEMIHAYKKSYEAAKGQEKIGYPRTRVIPVDKTIKAGNVIHTYDQMMTYVDKYDTVGVGTCYCRYEAKLRGEDIREMPLEVCMWFGEIAEHIIERLGGRRVSKQEAKEILDRCEEAGLIHMSRNTTDDIDFVCNCDRWHCEVVTNVLKQPKPGRVFNSGFQPVFDSDRCIACETCIDRCPPQALSLDENDGMVLNLDLCFGCGVCATGCPQEAIAMEAKPDFPTPPKNVKELVAALKASAS
jgi:2-oxoacid:acceptor oxidoreductase delta subunit (pyruvate/2-ketoisovalerate family)